MANRNRNSGPGWNRNRDDYGRGYDQKPFNRPPVNPWQGGINPSNNSGNVLPMGSVQSDATTLAIANNLIALLGQRNNVPSLLDMPPVRRDFGNFDRGFDGRPSMARMGKGGPNFNRRNQLPPRRSGPQNRPPGQLNKTPKKNDNAAKSADSKEEDEPKDEEGKTDGDVKTKYDVISPEFLQCHICDKRMWDGRSFQNHLNGRAHNLMMAKTKESYNLTADAMRQELKIFEMKRLRRNNEKRDFYCAMCDLYVVDGPSHRTSIGHRRLKKYLHPSCNVCRKEMPTRIEFDEHRLTLAHLKVLQERNKDTPKIKEAMIVYTLQQEMAHVKYPKMMKGGVVGPKGKVVKKEGEVGDEVKKEGEESVKKEVEGEGNQEAKEGEAEAKNGEAKEGDEAMDEAKVEEVEAVGRILDVDETTDYTQVKEENVPTYDTEVGVGKSYIGDFGCKQCILCEKLLDTEETAKVHLKTWKHYKNFVFKLREKAGLVVKKEPGQKRNPNHDEDEDSTAKRIKTDGEEDEKAEEDEDEKAEGDEAMETDTQKLIELIDEEMKGESWEKIDELAAQGDEEVEGETSESETAVEPAPAPEEQQPEPAVEPAAEPAKEEPPTGRGTPRGRRGRPKKT